MCFGGCSVVGSPGCVVRVSGGGTGEGHPERGKGREEARGEGSAPRTKGIPGWGQRSARSRRRACAPPCWAPPSSPLCRSPRALAPSQTPALASASGELFSIRSLGVQPSGVLGACSGDHGVWTRACKVIKRRGSTRCTSASVGSLSSTAQRHSVRFSLSCPVGEWKRRSSGCPAALCTDTEAESANAAQSSTAEHNCEVTFFLAAPPPPPAPSPTPWQLPHQNN